MKTKIMDVLKAGLLAIVAAAITSCQTTSSDQTSGPAVMCDKCQTVWVKRAQNIGTSNKGGTTIYRNEKVMQCPDCENAIVTFFKTGELKHRCTHCGGTMTHCTQH